jgi:3-oxoadipate enol-lactonase
MIQPAMSSTPTLHQYTTKNGTRSHYELRGSSTGRLVVLLHGLGGSIRTFEPLLPLLPSQTHGILAVDFEGFGKTPLTDSHEPLSIDRYVADLDDLIAHIQRDRFDEKQDRKSNPIIIGHSLGSIVALHYAAEHPSEVDGLALLGVGRTAARIPAVKERMLTLAATVRTQGVHAAADIAVLSNFPPGDGTTDVMRREVRETVESSNAEAYAQICEAMVSTSHQDPHYAAITCPVSLIAGIDDTISPVARALELAPLFGGKCIVTSVKGGHQPILSDIEGTCGGVELMMSMVME